MKHVIQDGRKNEIPEIRERAVSISQLKKEVVVISFGMRLNGEKP